MYHIVGRDGVRALWAKKWQEAWEAHRQQEATRAAHKKKTNRRLGESEVGI